MNDVYLYRRRGKGYEFVPESDWQISERAWLMWQRENPKQHISAQLFCFEGWTRSGNGFHFALINTFSSEEKKLWRASYDIQRRRFTRRRPESKPTIHIVT
jgi:hypothetical protein